MCPCPPHIIETPSDGNIMISLRVSLLSLSPTSTAFQSFCEEPHTTHHYAREVLPQCVGVLFSSRFRPTSTAAYLPLVSFFPVPAPCGSLTFCREEGHHPQVRTHSGEKNFLFTNGSRRLCQPLLKKTPRKVARALFFFQQKYKRKVERDFGESEIMIRSALPSFFFFSPSSCT
jgi:hypothetical protein